MTRPTRTSWPLTSLGRVSTVHLLYGLLPTLARGGEETIKEVDRWLEDDWPTKEMAGEAWHNRGEVILCESDEEMVKVSDEVATEHLEVQTRDPDWFLDRLTNYGSLF